MATIPKFLICDNPMAEDGQEYILHTQEPKVLFKVIIGDDNTIEFVVAQEYDKLSDLSAKRLDGLMSRMARWFLEYDKYMDKVENELENHIDHTPLDRFKRVNLEDAHAMSIISSNTFEVPSNEEINQIEEGDYVKVCTAGERFWCQVVYVHKEAAEIYAIIDNDLINTEEHDLNNGDGIIIKSENIYAIQNA